MRPAYSVILFTTATGAAYGLLAVLGGMLLLDIAGDTAAGALLDLALGRGLAGFGLVA